jgi:uncharacterized membrane protein
MKQKKTINTSHDDEATAKLGFLSLLRRWFLAGLLVSAPIILTFYGTWILISFIDGHANKLVPSQFNPSTYVDVPIPGIGIIFVGTLIVLIGALTTGLMGKTLVSLGESLLNRVPVIRSLYGATKQIMETVMSNRSDTFREVVLLEYPRPDVWVIGFITGATRGEVQNRSSEQLVNIFVPTTPNPTSGFLLFCPREDVITLDMGVEEAVKMVVSAGIITPDDPKVKRKTILFKKGNNKTAKKKTTKKKPTKKKAAKPRRS